MKKSIALVAGILTTVALSGAAIGQDNDKAIADAVKARKAQMQLYAYNLGLLGGMAKGDIAYDATAASAAASNLAALTKLDQSRLWPQGSDDMSAEGSRALPALWENIPDVMAKGMEMAAAADAMAGVAGNGLEALQAQMGAVGGACAACHKPYRAPSN